MHGVWRRQVQERCWSYQLQQLSGRLELAFAEHSSEQLHLQRGLFWCKWRRMHGVRRRQVQERCWSYQLQQLPGRLELAHSKHCTDKLQMQRRKFWA